MPDSFETILHARTGGAVAEWLARTWPGQDEQLTSVRFRAAFAGMARRVGQAPLSNGDAAEIGRAGIIGAAAWPLDQVGRTALLLRAMARVPADDQAAFVREVYLRGDYREQAAVLRSLSLLPDPVRFTEMAIDACRTNVVDVFEAIACENNFPADHFPELNFNQLVLKAIFMEVAAGRIAKLAARVTPELKRMATDFASERSAAGRTVPADIEMIVGMEMS